jgi:hypothetical protein
VTATHDLHVRLVDGQIIIVPTERPDQTTTDVARALAERLKPGTALWAPCAVDEIGDALGAVVVPVSGIAFVEVLARPAEVLQECAPVPIGQAAAVLAAADHAAASDTDTATTAPTQPTPPELESVPPAEPANA